MLNPFLVKAKEDIGRCDLNKDLINTLFKSALEVEKKLGVPATFQVAQAILESGWDITPLIINGVNSYNIYGIKYHRQDGKFVKTTGSDAATYQAYKDFEDCFNDHATLLTMDIGRPISYAKALAIYKLSKDLDRYVLNVSKVYATDPLYYYKILGVIARLENLLEVKVELKEPTEFDKAFDLMVRLGVYKPYGDLDTYKDKLISRRELAVILARVIEHQGGA